MAQNNGRLSREQQSEMYRSTMNGGGRRTKTSAELNDVLVRKNKPPRTQHTQQYSDYRSSEKTLSAPRTDNTAGQRREQPKKQGFVERYISHVNSKPRRSLGEIVMQTIAMKPDAKPVECVWFANRGRYDMPLFIVVIILLVFGIVMMTSASYAYSYAEQSDSFAYMINQLWGAVMGVPLMLVAARLDYHFLLVPIKSGKKRLENGNGLNFAHILFAFACVLMIMVFFFGVSVNDAKRWLVFMGVQFQPSEILKIALVIMMAAMLQRFHELGNKLWYGFIRYWFVVLPALLMCLMQRHVSAMLLIFVISLTLMFVGGCKRGGMLAMIIFGAAAILFLLFVAKWDYLIDRINGFMNPFADTGNTTYQTYQSLVTIGSGGWFGLGLGNSRQKYFYLPESQNDFVFSIICEELGFIGGITIILLFVLLAVRGFYIAIRAKDKFGMLVALGITVQITLQALLNIGVACNAIPNTGISLPFFSYGRTALIIQLLEMGLLLSISRQSDT